MSSAVTSWIAFRLIFGPSIVLCDLLLRSYMSGCQVYCVCLFRNDALFGPFSAPFLVYKCIICSVVVVVLQSDLFIYHGVQMNT